MEKLYKICEKFSKYTIIISGLMIFATILLVIVNIVIRRFTPYSIVGSTEIVRYAMCVAAAIALSQNEWIDGNVRVTIILEVLKGKAKLWVDFITYLIASIGFIPITYFMFQQAAEHMRLGTQTTELFMPLWIFSGLLAVGFLFVTVIFWCRTILKGYAIKHPETPIVGTRDVA